MIAGPTSAESGLDPGTRPLRRDAVWLPFGRPGAQISQALEDLLCKKNRCPCGDGVRNQFRSSVADRIRDVVLSVEARPSVPIWTGSASANATISP